MPPQPVTQTHSAAPAPIPTIDLEETNFSLSLVNIGMVVSVLVAVLGWLLRLEFRLNTVERKSEDTMRDLTSLESKIDKIQSDLNSTAQSLAIITVRIDEFCQNFKEIMATVRGAMTARDQTLTDIKDRQREMEIYQRENHEQIQKMSAKLADINPINFGRREHDHRL